MQQQDHEEAILRAAVALSQRAGVILDDPAHYALMKSVHRWQFQHWVLIWEALLTRHQDAAERAGPEVNSADREAASRELAALELLLRDLDTYLTPPESAAGEERRGQGA